MEKYKQMINSLLLDVEENYKEDLMQELYLTIINIQNEDTTKIKNLDSYIYISLKNKKISFLKERRKEKYISLNTKNEYNNEELVNSIPSQDSFSYSNEKVEFCKTILDFPPDVLSDMEKNILIEYYQNNKKQVIIARENNVSPQYVNRTIKRILKKLFDFFKNLKH